MNLVLIAAYKKSIMKNVKIPAVLIFITGFVSSVNAQTIPVINKKMKTQFDMMLTNMKKINVTNPEQVKTAIPTPTADQIFDATLPTLNTEIAKGKKDIEKRNDEYIVASGVHANLIEKDLLSLMAKDSSLSYFFQVSRSYQLARSLSSPRFLQARSAH